MNTAPMWANINRSGHDNSFHSHPGAFWSGVYYVDPHNGKTGTKTPKYEKVQ